MSLCSLWTAFVHLLLNYSFINKKDSIKYISLIMNWNKVLIQIYRGFWISLSLSVHCVGLLISEIILGRRGDCTNPSPRRFYFIIEIFWAEICYLRKIAVVNEREDNCNHYWKGSCYLIKFPKLFCF